MPGKQFVRLAEMIYGGYDGSQHDVVNTKRLLAELLEENSLAHDYLDRVGSVNSDAARTDHKGMGILAYRIKSVVEKKR